MTRASVSEIGRVDTPWGHEEIFAVVQSHHVAKTLHVTSGRALSDAVVGEASTAAPRWRDDVVRESDGYWRSGSSAP